MPATITTDIDLAASINPNLLRNIFLDDDVTIFFGEQSTSVNQSIGKIYYDSANTVFALESTRTGAGTSRDWVVRVGNTPSEAMRAVASSQFIGIGTGATVSRRLHVLDNSNPPVRVQSNSSGSISVGLEMVNAGAAASTTGSSIAWLFNNATPTLTTFGRVAFDVLITTAGAEQSQYLIQAIQAGTIQNYYAINTQSNQHQWGLGSSGNKMTLDTGRLDVTIDAAVAGFLGVGVTTAGSVQEKIRVQRDDNSLTTVYLFNNTSGTTAGVQYVLDANTKAGAVQQTSAGFTPTGGINAGELSLMIGSGASSVSVVTQGNTPLRFITNSVERWRIIGSDGTLLGGQTTPPAGLGIYMIAAVRTQNDASGFEADNLSAGAAASAFLACATSGNTFSMTSTGPGFTPSGIVAADQALLTASEASGGLVIRTTGGNFPIIFGPNNTEQGRFTVTPSWQLAATCGVETKATSPGSIGADQNNYNPGTGYFFRLTSSANINITGLLNGVDGRQMLVVNIGANNISFTHQDGSSTDINRIITPTAGTITLGPSDAAWLIYDATTARWRLLGLRGLI